MKYYMVKFSKDKTEFINVFDDIWIRVDTYENDEKIREMIVIGIKRINLKFFKPPYFEITDEYFITQRILEILDIIFQDNLEMKSKIDDYHYMIIRETKKGGN